MKVEKVGLLLQVDSLNAEIDHLTKELAEKDKQTKELKDKLSRAQDKVLLISDELNELGFIVVTKEQWDNINQKVTV